ncbi:adenylosuccinate synthetase [Protomyces lactucae-debilis]|uniref:Adenylosuccinate synthetase n=1 Tax=Protomyces lactucae-debilis TaxID=2754530 RepID=A0A1Y2FGI9_PROLT|nr:adenylosuccinate synthetase [Protomyces lactucae-debilis]ORY83051.1 adenylosuccinate synthetase [Protomyces lactucae-debilis]
MTSTLKPGQVSVVLGSQWGDEGKGKLVDILTDKTDVCARCQGGNNAGHTIVVDGKTFDFHILPSGLVNPQCVNLIGSGCVVHIPAFFKELEAVVEKGLNADGRLFISDRAHLVFDYHQIVDGLKEGELGSKSLGTTRKGIGPTYSSKSSRSGVRLHHLMSDWVEFEKRFRTNLSTRGLRYGQFDYDEEKELAYYKSIREKLQPFVVDAVHFMHQAIKDQKRILIEGANALMLDLDFGTYPYVTSSPTTIGGVCTGLGIPPQRIGTVWGVVKAYTTRVGAGPFPTEQLNAVGEKMQDIGREWGVTTGRKRRCGWLDLVVIRYSTLINGYTALNITKLDVLDTFEELQVAVSYEIDGKVVDDYFPADLNAVERAKVNYKTFKGWNCCTTGITEYDALPAEAKAYVEFIEKFVGVPVGMVGVGPSRNSMLLKAL